MSVKEVLNGAGNWNQLVWNGVKRRTMLIKVFFSISERKILEEIRELKLLKNKFVSLSWMQSLVQNTCKRYRYYLKHMGLPGRHLFDVKNITRHRKLVIHQG
jgi:hypothetical protein